MAKNEALHNDFTPSYIGAAALAIAVAVKLSTARNTVEVATSNADRVQGITLDSTDAAGEAISIKKSGFALATVGTGNRAKGARLTAGANGTLVATTTAGHVVCAIAQEAATAGEFGEVYVLETPVLYSALV